LRLVLDTSHRVLLLLIVETEPAKMSDRTSDRVIFTTPPDWSMAVDRSISRSVATANKIGSKQKRRICTLMRGIAAR
jgi:hypothetical protein